MNEPTPESRAMTPLVSPDQREAAVQSLTAAFTADAIPVDEFERRVAAVYAAESSGALQKVIEDLPQADTGARSVPAPMTKDTGVTRRPSQTLRSVLSSVERTLDGPMPERLDVRSVVGSLELDLRRADFPRGVTEIRVRAILGNVEIELPRHVRVENDGHALLGTFSMGERSRNQREDAPVVRITGRSILANVEVELDD